MKNKLIPITVIMMVLLVGTVISVTEVMSENQEETISESQIATMNMVETLTNLRQDILSYAPVETNEEVTEPLRVLINFIDERPLLLEVPEIKTLRAQLDTDLTQDFTKPFLQSEKGKFTTQTALMIIAALALIYGLIAARRKFGKDQLKKKIDRLFADIDEMIKLMQHKEIEIKQKAESTKDKSKITGNKMIEGIIRNINRIIEINNRISKSLTLTAVINAEQLEIKKAKKEESFVEGLKKDEFVKQHAALLTRLNKFDELEHEEKRMFARIHYLISEIRNSLFKLRESISKEENPQIDKEEKGKGVDEVFRELETIHNWTNEQYILFNKQFKLLMDAKSHRDELVDAVDRLILEEKAIHILKKPAKKEAEIVSKAATLSRKPSITSEEMAALCSEIVLPAISNEDVKLIERKLNERLIVHDQPPQIKLKISGINKEGTALFYIRKDNEQTLDVKIVVANENFLKNLKIQLSALGMKYLNLAVARKMPPEEIVNYMSKKLGIFKEKTVRALLEKEKEALSFEQVKKFIEHQARELPEIIEKQFEHKGWEGIREYGMMQKEAIQQRINLSVEKNNELAKFANEAIIDRCFKKWAKEKGYNKDEIQVELGWLTPFTVPVKVRPAA